MLGAVTRGLGLLLGLSLGLSPTLACEVSNEDHCLHRAIESDAWCAAEVPGKPFCSPCVAEEHGCVAEQPSKASCPRYEADSASTTASSTGRSSTGD